jgi:High potential iron-sulfur protein
MNRKDVIVNLLAMPIAAGAVVLTASEASAAATVDQKTAQYQSKPKNGQQCSTCTLYVPAKSNPSKANGTCKIVKGAISPTGWCKFYAKK